MAFVSSLSSISKLADDVLSGNRRALAKAITLVESDQPGHRGDAETMLDKIVAHTGNARRIGISGAPGVGKSTFIDAFGMALVEQGQKLAVLAVDPSSRLGGSILGDKTRMEQLSLHPGAYVRPSPSAGSLGGVARRTRQVMMLVEAAGFDTVIVETVGVGQSETAVADMTDIFLLLLNPGGGDDLQGIKRGIMELADLVIVNKADGELEGAARRAQNDYRGALSLMRPKHIGWQPPVLKVSALTGRGLDAVIGQIGRFFDHLNESEALERLRADQRVAWFRDELAQQVWEHLHQVPELSHMLATETDKVRAGKRAPTAAGHALVKQIFDRS
ncbi:MAG: methylmalonyl Co-A mutase-associated GTPase MeaB [Pseudomonadota bacterium]